MGLLDVTLYGNTVAAWAIALGLAAAIVVLVALAVPLLARRLGARAEKTHTAFDDALVAALHATRWWLVAVAGLYLGGRGLALPAGLARGLAGAATVVVFLQGGLWLDALLGFWLARSRRRALAINNGAGTPLSAVGLLGRLLLWAVVLLLALDNVGVNITALAAGLGIGGIAVALAVQNILGDLFASLSIVIDKPFVIGDFIIVDGYMGTVEHVGLKTTRLRSLDGEQIVFANGDLLKSRLRNYQRMYERRVQFAFKLRHTASPEQLEQVPPLVQGLLADRRQVRFERSHFAGFGEGCYNFETVYWVLTPDYNAYMDIQQDLNLKLLREFARRGIELALPVTLNEPAAPPPEERSRPARPRERVIHQ